MTERFLYAVEREYPHPVERLWQAWTTASELQEWYHPTMLDTVADTAESNAVVGGVWAIGIDVSMNGFNAYFFGTYTRVKPLVQLEHTMAYTQSAEEFAARPSDAPTHRIVIDFEARGDRAWVRFSQFGDLPDEQIQATIDGMTSYFASLENFLG